MKFKEAIKMLEADGWVHCVTKGSHHHYKHPIKPGKVTVPIPKHDDIDPRTLESIKKQAGLK